MFMVKVPFDECLARPSDAETYLLKKHLENVGINWSKSKEGYEQILFFIGGLCHDIGKAQSQWQAFARENNKKKPNHSKIGSLIFAYLAQKYVQIEKLKEKKLFHLITNITYDISSHHGDLKDVNSKYPPWHRDLKVFQGLESIDLKGFEKFIYQKLPILDGKARLEIEHLKLWGESFVNVWKSNLITRETFSYHQWKQAAKKCLRQDTASFIYADRLDAAGFKEINKVDKKDFKKVVRYLEEKCKERAGLHGEMNILREKTQTKVLEK
jgi:CRISPR-associated endonuclease Cas3-HD